MTPDEVKARIELVEDAYEFFLAYAAQGLSAQAATGSKDSQVRSYLRRCDEALTGLADGIRANLPNAADHEEVIVLLRRDADATRALIRLVAAQPAVSSQVIDNLNASVHVRALLTDLFLLGDLAKGPEG